MLLLGLLLGRWWRVVIPVGSIAWAIALVATDVGSGVAFVIGCVLIAAANIAVGTLVFQGVRLGIRSIRHA